MAKGPYEIEMEKEWLPLPAPATTLHNKGPKQLNDETSESNEPPHIKIPPTTKNTVEKKSRQPKPRLKNIDFGADSDEFALYDDEEKEAAKKKEKLTRRGRPKDDQNEEKEKPKRRGPQKKKKDDEKEKEKPNRRGHQKKKDDEDEEKEKPKRRGPQKKKNDEKEKEKPNRRGPQKKKKDDEKEKEKPKRKRTDPCEDEDVKKKARTNPRGRQLKDGKSLRLGRWFNSPHTGRFWHLRTATWPHCLLYSSRTY